MSVVGKTAEVHLRLLSPDSAEARSPSPRDGFPAAFVTSRLVDMMELAAARLMRSRLAPGESTLGIELKLTHVAATTPGAWVRAVATYRCISGRLHRFSIHAFDRTGLIATCEHTRAVVTSRRLLAQARKRAGRASMLLEN
jgi:predicted thioesterase